MEKITFKTKDGRFLRGIRVENNVTFVNGFFALDNTAERINNAFHSCKGEVVENGKAKFFGMDAHDVLAELGYPDDVRKKYAKDYKLSITLNFMEGWEES